MSRRRKKSGDAFAVVVGAAAIGLGIYFLDQAARKRRAHAERVARVRPFVEQTLTYVSWSLGVPKPRLCLLPDVPNAAAAMHDGTIHVNLGWMEQQFEKYCGDQVCERAVALAVVAHELGHVMDRSPNKTRWQRELTADHVAGMALAQAGMSPEPFVRLIAATTGSETHPPPSLRIPAIREGYRSTAVGAVA